MKTAMKKTSIEVLSKNAKARLLKNSRRMDGIKGQIMMQKGDPIGGVIIVQKGTLRVFAIHPSGREATLYTVSNDEICLLSMNSSFAGTTYPAWVSVDSKDVTLAMVPIAQFREVFDDERDVQDLVIHSLNGVVKDLLVRLDEALLSSLRDRIYSFLSYNADINGQLNLTHGELAQHMGSSREVVSRELSALKKAKLVSGSRGTLCLVGKSLQQSKT